MRTRCQQGRQYIIIFNTHQQCTVMVDAAESVADMTIINSHRVFQ